MGEVGKAFVVLKPEVITSAEELLAHLGDRLARYKIPRHIEFVASLPMSAAGKVLRRELRSAT
jgi:fatty-acyl-CoA synthase